MFYVDINVPPIMAMSLYTIHTVFQALVTSGYNFTNALHLKVGTVSHISDGN